MMGNGVLRAMLVTKEIKAGVIWAGSVYSYEDFVRYGINDSSYVHKPYENKKGVSQRNRETSPEIQKIRSDPKLIDFNNDFWTSISLTKNIKYLSSSLQNKKPLTVFQAKGFLQSADLRQFAFIRGDARWRHSSTSPLTCRIRGRSRG